MSHLSDLDNWIMTHFLILNDFPLVEILFHYTPFWPQQLDSGTLSHPQKCSSGGEGGDSPHHVIDFYHKTRQHFITCRGSESCQCLFITCEAKVLRIHRVEFCFESWLNVFLMWLKIWAKLLSMHESLELNLSLSLILNLILDFRLKLKFKMIYIQKILVSWISIVSS